MRLVSYQHGNQPRAGWVTGGVVWDLRRTQVWAREQGIRAVAAPLPVTLRALLEAGPAALAAAQELYLALAGWDAPADARAEGGPVTLPLARVHLLAPLPEPGSLRLFVAPPAGRPGPLPAPPPGQSAGAQAPLFPAFAFGNHHAILGPGDPVTAPPGAGELDLEFHLACVIGRPGRDLDPRESGEWVAGYTILNDWTARDWQRAEQAAGLPPAKSKDFATSLGPWLVTPDELAGRTVAGEGGQRLDLAWSIRVAGQEVARGNLAEQPYPWGLVLARASAGTWLRPGDVLSAGPLPGGSLAGLGRGGSWLQPGDVVEIEVEGLGSLSTPVAGPSRRRSRAPRRGE